jgi:hypothetical protein
MTKRDLAEWAESLGLRLPDPKNYEIYRPPAQPRSVNQDTAKTRKPNKPVGKRNDRPGPPIKKECLRGHPLSGKNLRTRYKPNKNGKEYLSRECRECSAWRERERYRRLAA